MGITGLHNPKDRGGLGLPNSALLCLAIFPFQTLFMGRELHHWQSQVSIILAAHTATRTGSPSLPESMQQIHLIETQVLPTRICVCPEPVTLAEDSRFL